MLSTSIPLASTGTKKVYEQDVCWLRCFFACSWTSTPSDLHQETLSKQPLVYGKKLRLDLKLPAVRGPSLQVSSRKRRCSGMRSWINPLFFPR